MAAFPAINPVFSDFSIVDCFDPPAFAADRNEGLAGLDLLDVVDFFCFAMVLKPVETVELKVMLLLPLRKVYVEVVL